MIPFIDLKAQQERIRTKIDAAIARVLDHGAYVMGPEITELEAKLAQFCGAKHALACANGTEAIIMALMAKNVGPGDAVIVPSFTFAATAEAVAILNAVPIFADVLPDTFNIDPNSIQKAIQLAKKEGLKPNGIIPVDLFGQPADYAAINQIAQEHTLWVIADAAQSFGATYHERVVGTLGDMTTTSFFPAKPLGCYGDGGAIFTDSDELAEQLKSIRSHGQGKDRYGYARIGVNGRLDTIQAAVLLEKLAIFKEELIQRQAIADQYSSLIRNVVETPHLQPGLTSAWAQYTIKTPHRQTLMDSLKEEEIPTVIYYPHPLHQQTAYRRYPVVDGALPISDQVSNEVLSLPMHPYQSQATTEHIGRQVVRILNC